MFVETSLEVSSALSPKPLTPAVETLPLLFMRNSLVLKQKLELCWGSCYLGGCLVLEQRCNRCGQCSPGWAFPPYRTKLLYSTHFCRAVLNNMGLFEGHFVLTLFQPHAQQMGGLKSPNLLAQTRCPHAVAGSAEELHPNPGYSHL